MKGLVYHGPEQMTWEEVPEQELKPGYVKIQTKSVGICGSDLHGYLGKTGRRIAPMIMGHEFSGQVAQIGERVTSCAVGDRVVVQPVLFCGSCAYCAEGLTNLCENKRFLGVMDCNGAMAEYVWVPEQNVIQLPEDVSFEEAALVEPLAVAQRGVEKAGDLSGRSVLIIGAGTIGLLALMLVRNKNPRRIFVSDLSSQRLETAEELGADVTVNPRDQDLLAVIQKEFKSGVDVAIEAVGVTPTVGQATACVRPAGRMVWVGLSQGVIEVNMQKIVAQEVDVRGSYIYTAKSFKETFDLLVAGNLPVMKIVSKIARLEEGAKAFESLLQNADAQIKVLLQ